MKYKEIKPTKLYEQVAEAIHEMIRSGQLKPGDKLDSVEQLAENFQVGRSAIREALSALRAMGLLEMKQGEGTYIKEFSPDQIFFPLSTAILMNQNDVENLLEVRKIIETGAVASASKKRTSENLTTMELALEEMKKANGNEELGEKADLAFHLAIADASQNQLLSSLLKNVAGLMQATMKETRRLWLYSGQTTTEKLYEEHKNIYEAIFRGDENAAREAMVQHLENVDEVLSEYFEKTSKNQ
ncbi:FadR family transcriptional regulator [Bacillus sp. IITD106]|nr:FadR family transcriptional regulator [Bacillus sp. IITD106]